MKLVEKPQRNNAMDEETEEIIIVVDFDYDDSEDGLFELGDDSDE